MLFFRLPVLLLIFNSRFNYSRPSEVLMFMLTRPDIDVKFWYLSVVQVNVSLVDFNPETARILYTIETGVQPTN